MRFIRVLTVLVIILSNGTSIVKGQRQISKGHQLIAEKGLQIMALCSPQEWGGTVPPTPPPYQVPDYTIFEQSNFTGFNFLGNDRCELYLGPAPGRVPWSRWAAPPPWTTSLRAAELPYLPNMVSFQYLDEIDLTDANNLQAAKDWMVASQTNYPTVLCHLNQYGGQNTFEELQDIIAFVRPDMLMHDTYPFQSSTAWLGQSAPYYYSVLAKYRWLGLKGNDGDGVTPIPYGMYLQTYVRDDHTVSESEMRFNQFSAWTYGYTLAQAFVYTDASGGDNKSVLFSGIDDTSPTPLFYQMAETNRQSRNLGPTLVRLISTDLRGVVGQHISLSYPFEPEKNNWPIIYGSSEWDSTADPYITSISVTNPNSNVNAGLADTVIIGYFEPLFESDDGPDYENEIYFMVLNTMCTKTATVAEASQNIRIDFDFGTSGITGLLRRSRDNGSIEEVSLVHDGGSQYHLNLTLEGGTADLFKFDTGAPFVGETFDCPAAIEQGYGYPGDLNSDCKVNIVDLNILMTDWLRCVDAVKSNCEKPWLQ